jgi:hypothetical protein
MMPSSGLKQVDLRDTISARVSDTATSMEATWTVVDGVRELDEVHVEFRQRSECTATVRGIFECMVNAPG